MICISILIAGLCTIYSTVDRPCFQLQQCSVPISRQKTPTGESFGGAGPVGVLGTKEGKRGGGGRGTGQHLVQLLEEVGILLALLEPGVRVGLLHAPLPCRFTL